MKRWQIEVKFRDIKTTLKMEKFDVQTPKMAHKTLAMMVIAYNRLRCTMQEAAGRAGKRVHQMSVEGIRSVLTTSHESFRAVAGKPKLFGRLYDDMIKDCAQHTLDIRPFRREPRAILAMPG